MFVAEEEMKRPERLKLVEELVNHANRLPLEGRITQLLQQAAICIAQLENELDAIHENFIKESE